MLGERSLFSFSFVLIIEFLITEYLLILNADGFSDPLTPDPPLFLPIPLPFPSGGTTIKNNVTYLIGTTGHTEAIVQSTSLWKPTNNTNPNT